MRAQVRQHHIHSLIHQCVTEEKLRVMLLETNEIEHQRIEEYAGRDVPHRFLVVWHHHPVSEM